MFTSLVFILLAITTGTRGTPLTQNTRASEEEISKLRIIGGVEAVAHSLPYQVALIINNKSFCGGVLISSEYVLTAAHCVYESYTITVILGAHNIYIQENTQEYFYNPRVIVHEDFTNTSPGKADIALLKLGKHATLTTSIKPIGHLADASSGSFVGQTGLLSGWGYISSTSTGNEHKLRQVYLDIICNDKCNLFHTENAGTAENQICTSGVDNMMGPVGACFGDSGSPLVVNSVLVGLVSGGFTLCEAGHPTIHTRISYYRSWISKYSGI